MVRVIAVTMRKGGSGKTTTAVNLAAALVKRGKRVLLIDLDSQANATIALGVDPTEVELNVSKLLSNADLTPMDVIIKTDHGIDLIASHIDLAKVEAGMGQTDTYSLKNALEPLKTHYDYVIIDTPPSESKLTASALTYAREVLIPMQGHYFALDGLAQVIDMVERVKQGLNPSIRVIGILPTMINAGTNMSRIAEDAARERFGKLVYPFSVSYSIEHPNSTLEGIPLVLWKPEHKGSISYMQLAEEIDG